MIGERKKDSKSAKKVGCKSNLVNRKRTEINVETTKVEKLSELDSIKIIS